MIRECRKKKNSKNKKNDTQRRKNFSIEEEKDNTTAWKQVYHSNQPENEQMHNTFHKKGNLNNIQCIPASNLSMQEPHAVNQKEKLDRNKTYSQGNTNRSNRNI